MRSSVPRAARIGLAGVALLSGVGLALHIADYKVRGCLVGTYCTTPQVPAEPFTYAGLGKDAYVGSGPQLPFSWNWVTPWWAYALAVVVGLIGLALAAWIYPGGHLRRRQQPLAGPAH